MRLKRFGTFEGVFTPCLLSILGVIMYLRLGWVVGQMGLGGALLIIGFANVITILTALSMGSVVTNIRIGEGGAYSIISKSLGIEAGGAIGIPLYLSQAISIAFYITGFTECWVSVFSSHYAIVVSLITWFVLLCISYISAKLAFRLQFFVMAVIGFSLVSIFLGPDSLPANPSFFEGFSGNNFWGVFAVFFPAVTGVLAGATMSGELKDPQRSIPVGTFGAIVVSLVIYVFVAAWFSNNVSRQQLIANTSVVIDSGRWSWLVIAGIMGATLSSALNMFVSSPRTLLALGKHSSVPFSGSFSHINKRGEPTTAILFTSLLALLTLLLGTLDQVAVLLTLFFLITYGMINLSVFIEQSIGIASFRPTFRIPKMVSFLGGLGCVFVMFLINTPFTLLAMVIIAIVYVLLARREIKVYSPDVRSGFLVFVAEQLAKAAAKLPYYPKIWKPNLLVPVTNVEKISQAIPFIHSIVHPSGRVNVFSIVDPEPLAVPQGEEIKTRRAVLDEKLSSALMPLQEEDVFLESNTVEAPDFYSGTVAIMENLQGSLFPPNTVFLSLTEKDDDFLIKRIFQKSSIEGFGNIILFYLSDMNIEEGETINLWIRRQSPNADLAILIALQLEKNWSGIVRLIQAITSEEEKQEAEEYLEKLIKIVRLPADTEMKIMVGHFKDSLKECPQADVNIFGMPEEPDMRSIKETCRLVGTPVIFLRDSKHESAVA